MLSGKPKSDKVGSEKSWMTRFGLYDQEKKSEPKELRGEHKIPQELEKSVWNDPSKKRLQGVFPRGEISGLQRGKKKYV